MARILIERIEVSVAFVGATDRGVDILVAVIVDVAKSNAVSLLNVANASGRGDILETRPGVVTQQAIRDEHR